MKTGAQALVESLEKAGAEVVFGYPGGNVVDIFDALRTAKFKFVLGRHEQGSTHMADGYARATGKPGVVIVTSGPGATNAITGLATANMDGVPLVLVSGQVPLSQIGTDAFQEADMSGICRAATKHSFLVKSADEIPETVAEAFYIATHGKPGAVVIDLPKNIQEELTDARYPERIALRAYHPEVAASPRQISQLARLINDAKRPIIYAGGGVIAANAALDVAALAKKAEIPVATTLMGVGSFDETNRLSLGMAGMYGTNVANTAIVEADLILALGVRFNDRITGDTSKYAKRAKIVQVDCDPSSIDKNITVTLGIVADVKDLLTTVASRVKSATHGEWVKRLNQLKRKHPLRRLHNGVIMPQEVTSAIESVTKGKAILVTDVGQHQMWCARMMSHVAPRCFISSGGMGTMGFATPAAIGAAIAKPDSKVVAVMGDGGAQMTIEELIVAKEEALPITFVIINNGSLGLVRQMQDECFSGRHSATKLTSPNFVRLAAAYGIKGVKVTKVSALNGVIAQAIRARKPMLVEVVVDGEANV